MSPHDWSEGTKRVAEFAAFLCAGVSAVSLSQAAVVISILAGLVSIVLGGIRIHDRLKYGKGGE